MIIDNEYHDVKMLEQDVKLLYYISWPIFAFISPIAEMQRP